MRNNTTVKLTRRAFMAASALASAGVALGRSGSSLDLDNIRLIEMHSHILDEAGVELLRQERLTYTVTMAPYQSLGFVRKHKDILGACVWLKANEKDYLATAVKAVKEYPDILKGFKLHPSADRYTVTYDLLAGLFELANKHNLMIQSHTARPECNAALFRPLMEKFPKTKMMLIHGFPAEEAFDVVKSFPNVYIDNSYTAWGRDYQQAALKAIGRDRLIFGIDSPLGFDKKDGKLLPHFRGASREVASFYGNDPETVKSVFYRNAEKILGMK